MFHLRSSRNSIKQWISLALSLAFLMSGLVLPDYFRNQPTPSAPSGRINSAVINQSGPEKIASTDVPVATPTLSKPDGVTQKRVSEAYGNLPLQFEANKGQADSPVKFLSRGWGYNLFLTSTEAVLALSRPVKPKGRKRSPLMRVENAEATESPAIVRMKMDGANPEAQVAGLEELPGRTNYFIGNDPNNWRTDIPNYAKVQYKEVYSGIDLVYYGNQSQLEYDFIVAPGADPDSIRLSFQGARDVRVDARGDLVLRTAGGEVRQRKPVIYQEVEGTRRNIAGRYTINGKHQVGFKVAEYDVSTPLVIDPVLSYSTYFGNSNVFGNDIAVDSSGNAYITGSVGSLSLSGSIPTQNPLFPNRGADAFIAKLNAAGSALIYSTYLGGNGPDAGFGIALGASGDAYVMGHTDSTDFPTMNPFQANAHNANGICTSFNQFVQCRELFVTRLNATGSALVYSTYIGGTGPDYGFGGGLAVDSFGNAYLTGFTESTDFPTTSNAFQGAGRSYLTKLNTNASGAGSLVYSTYLATSGLDPSSRGVAVDSSGNAYVVALSNGSFPSTAKAFQRSVRTGTTGGQSAVLIAKLNTNPSTCTPDSNANVLCQESLLYSTYLDGNDGQGGSGDVGNGIAVDSSDNVYVTGRTGSTDFPTTPGAFQSAGKDDGTGLVNDAFVTKLNINPPICTPDAARNINCEEALIYSTYLGGSNHDAGLGIALDASGNAYVTGETGSADFPVKAPFQLHRDIDAFVAKVNPNVSGADSLVYSSYLGGGSQEEQMRIAVDSAGDAYVTGSTRSTDFPTTPGSLRPSATSFGQSIAFLSKIIPTPVAQTFLVSAIGPNKGGDTGLVSATVYGLGFGSGATVKLTRSGQPDIVGMFLSVTGGSQIAVTFDLAGKERGLWDVVVTNPGGASATLSAAFTIEAGRQQPGSISIIGRSNFRPGASGRINVVYTNNGNTDALLPIIIRIPIGVGFGFPIPISHQPLVPTPQPVDFSGLPMTFQSPDNPNTPANEAETIVPIIVYAPAGSTGSIPMNLTHPNTNCSGGQVSATVGAPVNADCLGAIVNLAAELLTEFLPGAECVKQGIELFASLIVPTVNRQFSLSSFIGNVLLGAINCLASLGQTVPIAAGIKIAILVTEIVIGKGGVLVEFVSACTGQPLFSPIPGTTSTLQTNCVRSNDPNDKMGSKGVGTARYLTGEGVLPYVILFENKPEATAPAQDVVITDQLDQSKFDFATFSLGPIAFGDQQVIPPPGLSEFNTDVDLRPANNLIVRINAKLEAATGLLTWRFASLDPATMLPTDDPLAGFLPPNVNSPEGDGSVFFTVTPKTGLVTGTEIRNRARIIFDTNDPIDTPEWLNTIDKSKPQSQVLPLAATQNSTGFEVKWGGTELESGVQSYEVFVSEDGGPFVPWLTDTSATSGFFFGKRGSAYSFYTVAKDAVGNREDAPAAADATTQISPAAVNIIDEADFFVRQHYRDFLNREPDTSGLAFWTDQITSCGTDTACTEVRRINVSAAFFLSIEFQQTGYLVYRMYKAAFGNVPNTPVPMRFNEFLPETQKVGQGVVVGQTGWELVLENNKNAFAAEFVARSRFTGTYSTTQTPEQFVDALFTNAGVTPIATERTAIINEFGAATNTVDTAARARVLRRVAENSLLAQQEFSKAFVLMQYFGYLRRNPHDAPDTDFADYNFWLGKLNQFNGNFVQAEMVKAFIVSTEYRGRFAN